jgi:hypothetical protein
MNTMLDAKGQQVVTFETAIRSASQAGTYADLLVKMFTSRSWISYRTALGPETWRAHEFDYFLIACDAKHEDVARVLAFKGEEIDPMAKAMRGDPSAHRRSLEDASKEWTRSPTGRSLIQTATDNGWISRTTKVLKAAPVSERVHVRLEHNQTKDELAIRGRPHRIGQARVAILRTVLDDFIRRETLTPLELRYCIDLIRQRLRKLAKNNGN